MLEYARRSWRLQIVLQIIVNIKTKVVSQSNKLHYHCTFLRVASLLCIHQ